MTNTCSAQDILREWRKLQAIKQRPEWRDWLPGKMKHERHREQYLHLQYLCMANEDALVDLIVSGELTEDEMHELMFFASDGSVRRETNRHMHGLMAKLRARRGKLPKSIQSTLDWLWQVHHW